jgi:N12 class adenine-specific DNA methylase/SAM-dependent methyltransferase
LEGLGLPSGASILEPGCGTGNFIGLRDEYAFVGVELDPTSAAIALALYPDAHIMPTSFAEKKGGGFDATVGNVPFGDYTVADKDFNAAGYSIHNYFIHKSLRLTKPGGLAGFVTSSYTLNSLNPAARIDMARYGEFLGALRLPNSAHHRVAGTDVLTDIVFFRRRAQVASVEEAQAETWVKTYRISPDTQASEDDSELSGVRDNAYFRDHPEMVLGTPKVVQGRFGPALEVTADPSRPLVEVLHARLDDLVATQVGAGRVYVQGEADEGNADITEEDIANGVRTRRVGSIYADAKHGFVLQRGIGYSEPFEVKGPSAIAELGQLIRLRDTYDRLLAEETRAHGDPEPVRAVLDAVYDAYAAKYGPINRFSTSNRKSRDDDGQERLVKVYPKLGGFRKDKMCRAILALENFDEESEIGTKAAIFAGPVIDNSPGILGVEDPAEAVALSISRTGSVDVATMAHLLGMSEQEALKSAADCIFADPDSPNRYIDAPTYLSGNVRKKLARARELETTNERFATNVAALAQVLPADVGIDEINLRLGVSWIASDIIEHAFNDLTGLTSWAKATVEYSPKLSEWTVNAPARYTLTPIITHEYGVPGHVDATKLLASLLNSQPIQVRLAIGDGATIIDQELTAQARDKAEALQDKLLETIVATPEWAERVQREYNDRFNSVVPRSYTGTHLQLNGLSRAFVPHEHQRTMVTRILHSPTALAAHPVGAGKTAEMVIAGQILRRAKMIQKPLYAVPNHMLEQFSREYLQLYPNAKILVADKDENTASQRAGFVSRSASETWDAVIISHSAFGRIPLSAEHQRQFLSERIWELHEYLSSEDVTQGHASTVKSREKKIVRLIAKLETKIDNLPQDDAYTFEEMGVDYLFVDEAHLFKNLETPSASRELAITGSLRATDLEMKLRYLREVKEGLAETTGTMPRVATFATATPVANSPSEAYVMLRYLNPELLADAQITSFDDFVATFTEKVSTMELSPAGTEYRLKERVAKYCNLPELHSLLGEVMDYIAPDAIKIPTPKVTNGGVTTVTIPHDDSLRRYTLMLGERAKAVRSGRVDPSEDNFLKITSDGRRAALDLTLVGRRYAEEDNSKLQIAAREIYSRYAATKDRVYRDIEGNPHSRTGALQMVFCDQSTPKDDNSWNVYEALRAELVRLGMPEHAVRFIHEAKTDADRHRLFQSVKSGSVNVLIGSTGKMGTGVNVQDRAIAVHHLDAPWRPDELTQRNGRVVRQGNQNESVDVVVYVNEGSFDVFSWQTLARKKRFIDQVLTSSAREAEDLSEDSISYAHVKALATGNPLHIRRAELDAKVVKLERRARAFHASQLRARTGVTEVAREIEYTRERIHTLGQVADTWNDFVQEHQHLARSRGTDNASADTKAGADAVLEQGQTATNSHIYTMVTSDEVRGTYDVADTTSEPGTERELDRVILNRLKSRGVYYSRNVRFEVDGLCIEARADFGNWNLYLTTSETPWRENPTGVLIKLEQHEVREGVVHPLRRLFTTGNTIGKRLSDQETRKASLETKLDYYQGFDTDADFPEAAQLEAMREERQAIENALKESSAKEEQMVADILSSPDPYLLDLESDSYADDDREREDIAASCETPELASHMAHSDSEPSYRRGI